MHNYEYILIDSSKRSNGGPCDFSYELNRPIRDISKMELVYSSLSNTILTFTTDDYFYFQEEGNPFVPGIKNKLYIQENSLNVVRHDIFYKEEIKIPLAFNPAFKWYETDGITIYEHAFVITQADFDLSLPSFLLLLSTKMEEQGSNRYLLKVVSNGVTMQIHPESEAVFQFGLDFLLDDVIYKKLGFQKKRYEYNTTFTSTEPLVKNGSSDRQITIPTGLYNFSAFLTTLQDKLNNVIESNFEYIVTLDDGFVSIEVLQDETFSKKFQLTGGLSIEYFGYVLPFPSVFDVKHKAYLKLEGTINKIEIYNGPYYNPDELTSKIQNSLDLLNLRYQSNYQCQILDTKLIITNDISKFRIINKTDSLLFTFNNDEFLNIHTSLPSTIFQIFMHSIQFENGSYTSDDILEFLKFKLNSEGRSGYDVSISLSSFKISINNPVKKFLIYFSKYNSVWKRFGFKQKDTLYLNEHISDYTASLESSDYILVQIKNVPTPITNKKTSGTFFIPIISSRYEVQTISENQSFNQSIYVGNLDLSDVHIKLLNDEGDVISSEELNLKMLIKCYK